MSKSNTDLTFRGNKLVVRGRELKEGEMLPNFKLTANDLSDLELKAVKGKVVVLSVVPSLDTSTCALQTKRFNQEAGSLGDEVLILTVSRDLPFAQTRWCGAEGVKNLKTVSDYKYRTFGETFGVEIPDMGLLARAVFVADKSGKVVHVEYVSDLSSEPDYAAALQKIKSVR